MSSHNSSERSASERYGSENSTIEEFSIGRYKHVLSYLFLFAMIAVLSYYLYNCKKEFSASAA